MLLCEYVLNSTRAPPSEALLFHTLLQLYLADDLPEEQDEQSMAATSETTRRYLMAPLSFFSSCVCQPCLSRQARLAGVCHLCLFRMEWCKSGDKQSVPLPDVPGCELRLAHTARLTSNWTRQLRSGMLTAQASHDSSCRFGHPTVKG